MATVTFDTYKFITTLREAGFEEKQAEAVSAAFKEAQCNSDLATKQDLHELELRLVKWGIGLALGQVAVISALVKLL